MKIYVAICRYVSGVFIRLLQIYIKKKHLATCSCVDIVHHEKLTK